MSAAEFEGDRLPDAERSVAIDLEGDGESVDAEAAWLRPYRPGDEQPERRGKTERRGRPRLSDAQLPNETRGTCRSSGRSGSKYVRFTNRKKDAIRLEGKVSTVVLRSRTTAL
jgi:hypothetical protein